MVDTMQSPDSSPLQMGEPGDTRMDRSRKLLRLPLQLVAALGAIAFLVIIVALLAWQSYQTSQRALIQASTDTIGYIRDSVTEKAKGILKPAEAQLGFLTRGPLADATTLAERLQEIPVIAETLQQNPLIDAIYAGYPDGEFVLYRPLHNDADRRRFSAPDQAALLVQSVTTGNDHQMIGEYRVYDEHNMLLSSTIEQGYRFDPRTRPWYQAAADKADPIITAPYVFFTTQEIGITLARRTRNAGAVIGLDAKLTSLATTIASLKITPSAEVALVNKQAQLIAYRDLSKLIVKNQDGSLRLATVDDLGNPLLIRAGHFAFGGSTMTWGGMKAYGRIWQVIQSNIAISDTGQLKLLIAMPDDEFFASARQLVLLQLKIATLILVLSIPLIWWLTKKLVTPLRRLADETAKIGRFDFTADTKIRSHIREVNDLGRALDRMRRTIRKFLKIGKALAAERDFKPLLDRVLQETIDVVESDGGAIYMLDDEQNELVPEILRWGGSQVDEQEAGLPPISLTQAGIVAEIATAMRDSEIVVIQRRLEEDELTALGLREMVTALNACRLALVIVPLLDRNQVPLGVLLLVKALGAEDPSWVVEDRMLQLIHAVSGSASVAIQNKLLLDAQRELIDSLIKLVAGAIDAKSAYTGGHCQRVPVLTRMLAEAAVAQQAGPYRDFSLTDEEWEALDIAAWLHDCGKVTTPEYVVDKATKLETIYDRIHEIRGRFEILKRDAGIAYWRGLADGGDEASLRATMEAEKQRLDDDFAFVAICNEGGEFMEPAKIERLKAIAARSWTRTISNRLGVSYEEKARFNRLPEPSLPIEEPLLADRDDHIIDLAERDIIPANNQWGFHLNAPKVKYNRGELYNLCIARGTLTEEERYRINDHIVQTIIMLNSLPFPKHLKNVPELAGGHHEKMDGTGYPKRLKGGEMSVVARIMAIADVFEALTAADRPYKKAKKLSEAVKIMGFMKKDHHLDPDLMDLFLASGVWRDYAERFLSAEQIDEPDIATVIGMRPAAE
ncbi:MAG TPA: HD domain-containing phosphohydrolase [Dongiaceae bacterium]|nr:HD domain-containing phosphohydrolase [Dongiaceae bacterium]